MSLKPQAIGPVPEETARMARAAYPKGKIYIQLRDTLGTIDEDEHAFLTEFAAWMKVHGEGIYGTRPCSVYGEGAPDGHGPAQDQIEKSGKAYLDKNFPNLDSIKTTKLIGPETAPAPGKKPAATAKPSSPSGN